MLADPATPTVLLGGGIARGMEVARENAAVRQLLCRDPAVDRDHERLEEALPDRLAQKERARLLDDREVEPERREQRARVGTGGDHDGVGRDIDA